MVFFSSKYIELIYFLHTSWKDLNTYFTLDDCLFGTVKLTKNTKYESSGYDFDFHGRSQFSLPEGSWSKITIAFGVDNSSSVHVDNKKKNISVLGEGCTQGLDDTSVTEQGK